MDGANAGGEGRCPRKLPRIGSARGVSDATLLVAVNVCHADFFLTGSEDALYERADLVRDLREFSMALSDVSGVLVFALGGTRLGTKRSGSDVCEPEEGFPMCLESLRQEQCVTNAVGIE